MGYYIKKLSWKQSRPDWKVQFVSYKKMHNENSLAKKPKKTWDVKKERWKPLGFNSAMSFEDAKVRAKQLNQIENYKNQEIRLKKEADKQKLDSIKFYSKIPSEFSDEFEKRFVTKTFLSENTIVTER